MIRLHWQEWRRDLVAVLIGPAITAGALVPVGWSRVAAERSRAEAAEQRAEGAEQKVNEFEAKERAARELSKLAMLAHIEELRAANEAMRSRRAQDKSEKD
jgi:hypothetical protein